MSSSTTTGGPRTARTGLALALLLPAAVAGTTSASAAGAPGDEGRPVVRLAPDEVGGSLYRLENLPGLDLLGAVGTDEVVSVLLEPGATVTVTLPELVELSDDEPVRLVMADPADGDEGPAGPTFEAGAGTGLTAEVVDDGVLEVVVPPAEALELDVQATGTLAVPVVSDVVRLPYGTDEPSFVFYTVDLGTGRGATELDLEPLLVLDAVAEGTEVAAGGTVDVVLPEEGPLADLGVTTLDPLEIGLRPGGRLAPLDGALQVELVDGRTAAVTPTSAVPVGDHEVTLLLTPRDEDGEPLRQVVSRTSFGLDVGAAAEPGPAPTAGPTATPTTAPAAPAAPAEKPRQNEGLRSNTGVEDTGTSTTALVAGGGVVALALAGGAALLRRRTQR